MKKATFVVALPSSFFPFVVVCYSATSTEDYCPHIAPCTVDSAISIEAPEDGEAWDHFLCRKHDL